MVTNAPNSEGPNLSARRVMKRCFMNGMGCKFSSASTHKNISDKVFVIMPYGPNIKTFYHWKGKELLAKKFNMNVDDFQTADEIDNIGNIICRKICNKIQSCDYILADISLNNPNVYYELGLACGLQRPIILMQNKRNESRDACVNRILNFINDADILNYSNEGIDSITGKNNLEDLIQKFPRLEKQNRKLKISVMKFKHENEIQNATRNDVAIDFETLIEISAERAIRDILDESKKNPFEPWQQVMNKLDEEAKENFSKTGKIEIDCTNRGDLGKYKYVAEAIGGSFCIIIDISNNNPAAYFWLGYSHAKGLNVIPVNRILSNDKKPQPDTTLAFDINALWYAIYDETQPHRFKDSLLETITTLLERDLPDWQRQAFWDRFPQESKLKVFMGAIHSPKPNREVVGDWDVRTVSELFSYLPSIRNAANIQLETPLYSPEEASRRMTKADPAGDIVLSDEFIDKFCNAINESLEGSNAIVIASPDVNPVTEYLLHKIYKIKGLKPFKKWESIKDACFIALKKKKPGEIADKRSRLFYIEEISESGEEVRGFKRCIINEFGKLDSKDYVEVYKNQNDMAVSDKGSDEGFDLLGHLVVAYYPNDENDEKRNLVVLLNGISGPATFVLSQILTGFCGTSKDIDRSISENMLKELNDLLDERDCNGVEAIVKVRIFKDDTPNITLVDSRKVREESLDFFIEPIKIK
jgi:nucleoside 2-deoxyribosyltransferase